MLDDSDQYMGENVAYWLNIPKEKIAYWPGGYDSANYSLLNADDKTLKQFDNANLILFQSFCAVHTHYKPEMADYWKALSPSLFLSTIHPHHPSPLHSESTLQHWQSLSQADISLSQDS